jgi:hypothetical protein
VPINPASALVIENAAMMAGMAKLKICTSNASSAQPPKQAQNVRFSFGASSPYHPVNSVVELAFVMVAVVIITPQVDGWFHISVDRDYWTVRAERLNVLGLEV